MQGWDPISYQTEDPSRFDFFISKCQQMTAQNIYSICDRKDVLPKFTFNSNACIRAADSHEPVRQ